MGTADLAVKKREKKNTDVLLASVSPPSPSSSRSPYTLSPPRPPPFGFWVPSLLSLLPFSLHIPSSLSLHPPSSPPYPLCPPSFPRPSLSTLDPLHTPPSSLPVPPPWAASLGDERWSSSMTAHTKALAKDERHSVAQH